VEKSVAGARIDGSVTIGLKAVRIEFVRSPIEIRASVGSERYRTIRIQSEDCRIAPTVAPPQSTTYPQAIGALAHDPIEPELGGVAETNAAGRDSRRA
jgi:hypothetical protein